MTDAETPTVEQFLERQHIGEIESAARLIAAWDITVDVSRHGSDTGRIDGVHEDLEILVDATLLRLGIDTEAFYSEHSDEVNDTYPDTEEMWTFRKNELAKIAGAAGIDDGELNADLMCLACVVPTTGVDNSPPLQSV